VTCGSVWLKQWHRERRGARPRSFSRSRRVPRSNGCDGCTRPAVRRRSRAAAAPRPWRRMRS
jgi:hypothetical protein